MYVYTHIGIYTNIRMQFKCIFIYIYVQSYRGIYIYYNTNLPSSVRTHPALRARGKACNHLKPPLPQKSPIYAQKESYKTLFERI